MPTESAPSSTDLRSCTLWRQTGEEPFRWREMMVYYGDAAGLARLRRQGWTDKEPAGLAEIEQVVTPISMTMFGGILR